MIKAKARNLLELLREGKGIGGRFSNYHDKETGKIIDVIVNECKSLVKNSEGELRQYESTTSIGHIREIVDQLLSDKNIIGAVQAGVVMRNNGILGLAKELKVTKTVDEHGKLKLDIEKPFPDNFRDILTGTYNEKELREKIIKPYVAGLCEESEELSKRHVWSRRLNPFRPRKLSTNELQKRYSKYLEKHTDLDEENVIFKNEDANKADTFEYVAEEETDLKNMEISNQGGIIAFRYNISKIAEYTSDETEINHTELLKKANVSIEDLKSIISFNLTIILESGKEFQTTITLDLPIDTVVNEGVASIEYTDMSEFVFKRIQN